MIICDKCKRPVKTQIVVFGSWIIDRDLCPSWDLCDECSAAALGCLEDFIGVKGLSRRGK